mmetsp:Transcript_105699/g.309149  ORF Transcript_105699/g.309149 Transcript_105699/m.309149 type:complete len:306 (+) Transcript_105699:451-1368(+)
MRDVEVAAPIDNVDVSHNGWWLSLTADWVPRHMNALQGCMAWCPPGNDANDGLASHVLTFYYVHESAPVQRPQPPMPGLIREDVEVVKHELPLEFSKAPRIAHTRGTNEVLASLGEGLVWRRLAGWRWRSHASRRVRAGPAGVPGVSGRGAVGAHPGPGDHGLDRGEPLAASAAGSVRHERRRPRQPLQQRRVGIRRDLLPQLRAAVCRHLDRRGQPPALPRRLRRRGLPRCGLALPRQHRLLASCRLPAVGVRMPSIKRLRRQRLTSQPLLEHAVQLDSDFAFCIVDGGVFAAVFDGPGGTKIN